MLYVQGGFEQNTMDLGVVYHRGADPMESHKRATDWKSVSMYATQFEREHLRRAPCNNSEDIYLMRMYTSSALLLISTALFQLRFDSDKPAMVLCDKDHVGTS